MKLWITHATHTSRPNTIGSVIARTKEECISDALSENKRFAYPYNVITSVQEVEIDSDYLLFLLMTHNDLQDFQSIVRYLIATKDPSVKFGEIIPLETA